MNNSWKEFDFFMDEDMRAKRIGIICLEKRLTPALTQALFRVKENAHEFHKKRIEALNLKFNEQKEKMLVTHKQIREIKWSTLNLMRSFIAVEFIHQFFTITRKGLYQ